MGAKTTDLGKVAMTFDGTYSAETTYGRNSCVLYQNSTYVTLKDGVHGVAPSNDGVNWRLMAVGSKGDKGGYYAPSVSDDGVLTWSASESGMPAVSARRQLRTVNSNVFCSRMPPANPVDGVIWIQEDGASSNGVIQINVVESSTEPSVKSDGDIWIKI